jgi:hypothetical protein
VTPIVGGVGGSGAQLVAGLEDDDVPRSAVQPEQVGGHQDPGATASDHGDRFPVTPGLDITFRSG